MPGTAIFLTVLAFDFQDDGLGDALDGVSLSTAMKGKLGLKTMGATIYPYPTQAEAIRRTGDLYNRTRLTPFMKKLMQRWLAWQRGLD